MAASYTTEDGLRAALNNQDVAYLNFDSFGISEPDEYFWTFRAYEIAIQSNVKWIIYTGAPNRLAQHDFKEEYRNSHNVVKSRLANWLDHQDLRVIPWSIIEGGVYAEMLNTMLAPRNDDESSEARALKYLAPVNHDSVIPLVPVEMYGVLVKWMLEHPRESIGEWLSASPFLVTFPEIAAALSELSGRQCKFETISIDDWMLGASAILHVDATLPRGSNNDNPALFTFRRSFSAWWNLWRDSKEDLTKASRAATWLSKFFPERPQNIRQWMQNTNYVQKLSTRA